MALLFVIIFMLLNHSRMEVAYTHAILESGSQSQSGRDRARDFPGARPQHCTTEATLLVVKVPCLTRVNEKKAISRKYALQKCHQYAPKQMFLKP